MALKIKKALHDELIKIKRQKKGVSSYLIGKGYSKSWAESVSKNWATLEIIGGPANVSTTKKPSKSKKVTKTKTPSVDAAEIMQKLADSLPEQPRVYIGPPAAKEVIQTVTEPVAPEPEKELVVNISEGLEVKAEVRVKQLSHPRFFLASLVKILQKSGAKVTFNSGLDLHNGNENLSGFTLAINEDHELMAH